MKVSPRTEFSVQDTAAGKMVKFMANILLIPVSPLNNGKYELNIKSWRYFFSCLLWCVLPSVNEAYMMYQDYEHGIPSEADFKYFSQMAFIQLGSITALLNYWVLKVCGAYLVEQCGSISLLVLPSRKLQLTLFLVYSIGVCIVVIYIKRFEDLDKFLVPVYYFFVPLKLLSNLFLMNVFTSNFVQKCKNLRLFTDTKFLLKESESVSNAYADLKRGLGPSLLFHYTTSLLMIMNCSYAFVNQFDFTEFADNISNIFIIWNITSISQECYEEQQNANDVLRYLNHNFYTTLIITHKYLGLLQMNVWTLT